MAPLYPFLGDDMTTVRDIVTRSLKKIGVTAKDEDPDANDIAEGVDAFNMMLHGWKLRGVDVSHTTQDANDTFALASEYEEGTVYNLCSRLEPDYMVPASFDADDWFRAIQAAYTTIADADLGNALILLPSQRAKYGYTVDYN